MDCSHKRNEGMIEAFNNTWLAFTLKEFPQARVHIEIKPTLGVVDLRLYGVLVGDLRREFSGSMPYGADTDQASSGKSSAIGIRHTILDVRRPFPGQEAAMRPMLKSADTLLRFARQHRDGIRMLLGYEATA